jgi:hypothetical protein
MLERLALMIVLRRKPQGIVRQLLRQLVIKNVSVTRPTPHVTRNNLPSHAK